MASTGPVENPVAARDERIASDNQMLENIDRELNAPAASLDQEYGLQASHDASLRLTSTAVRN